MVCLTLWLNASNPNLQRIELGTIWNEWQDNWVEDQLKVKEEILVV